MPTDSALAHLSGSGSRLAPLTVGLAALLALALALHGPIAQWASYHAFADQRVAFGLPHAADVLSNLPFAIVGVWGLLRLREAGGHVATLAWRLFCIALIGAAAGSALYHLAPDNASLVFDRLPIACACAALLCGFVAERIDVRAGRLDVLGVALAAAAGSVAIWWWGEARGTGDLRAYLYVQFLPMVIVPAALLADRSTARHAVRAGTWWAVLGLYALAKAMEVADHAVFASLGAISGHTLKHLLAAAGAAALVAGFARCPRAGLISCGSPR
jgi:hypothetical protein